MRAMKFASSIPIILLLFSCFASLSLLLAPSLAETANITGSDRSAVQSGGDQPDGSTPPATSFQPGVVWNRTFGGNYNDGAWCLEETADGGFILAGNTAGRGEGSDLFLVRTDGNGSLLWEKTFGGSGEDAGYFVQQAQDGGFIVTGSTRSFGMGGELLWLLKTDGNGSLLWDRTFGGFVSSTGDGGWSVDETDDGGYIAAGYTQSQGSGRKDMWLLKTDALGNLLWEKTFGGQQDDVGMSVLQSRDGGFIVAGRTASFGQGGDDMWLLRTDSEGVELWNATFGGREDDAAFQVVETEDGYALAGRTESGGVGKRVALVRVNRDGRKIWQREYEGSSAASLALTGDGGFLLAGRVDRAESGRDALLIKTDSQGREQWSLILGGQGDEIGTFAVQCRDGSYGMAGIASSCGQGAEDAWLVKVDGVNRKIEAESMTGNATGNMAGILQEG